jgi:hypothetical protein
VDFTVAFVSAVHPCSNAWRRLRPLRTSAVGASFAADMPGDQALLAEASPPCRGRAGRQAAAGILRQGTIGIGIGLAASPSHTTGRTGPRRHSALALTTIQLVGT